MQQLTPSIAPADRLYRLTMSSLLLMVLLFFVPTCQGDLEALYRPQVGLHLHPGHSALLQTAGHIPLTFITDLPSFRMPTLQDACANLVIDCRLKENEHIKFQYDYINKLNEAVEDTFDFLDNAFKDYKHKDQRISKRGLLNAIGTGLKWLFGTATSTDIDKIHLHLKTLYLNSSEAAVDRNVIHHELTLLAKKIDERYSDLINAVNISHQTSLQLQNPNIV